MNIDETFDPTGCGRENYRGNGLMLNSFRCTVSTMPSAGLTPERSFRGLRDVAQRGAPREWRRRCSRSPMGALEETFPLAFDHLQIVDDALSCLRDNKNLGTD